MCLLHRRRPPSERLSAHHGVNRFIEVEEDPTLALARVGGSDCLHGVSYSISIIRLSPGEYGIGADATLDNNSAGSSSLESLVDAILPPLSVPAPTLQSPYSSTKSRLNTSTQSSTNQINPAPAQKPYSCMGKRKI